MSASTRISEEAVARLRTEMPGIDEGVYLNHGYAGRCPRSVVERIAERQERWQRLGPGSPPAARESWEAVEAARSVIAGLVGAAREAVALVPSTSMGLATVMAGLPWRAGDELLTCDREHIGLLTPAAAVAARTGAVVRTFPADAPDPRTAIEQALTPRTRLLALSEVLFIDGRVMPIPAIARLCHERGVLLLVDGAQSAGVLPVRPLEAGADFYAATCHKWLCGPEGTGFLLVAPEHLARGTVHPTVVGYSACGDRPGELASSARRYEGSTVNFADFSAVPLSLEFLRRGGSTEARLARIVSLARRFRVRLRELPGARLLLEPDEAQQSGLVSWTMDGSDLDRVARRLYEEYHVCVRTVPRPHALRASFHFFNTDNEVDRLVEALGALTGSPGA